MAGRPSRGRRKPQMRVGAGKKPESYYHGLLGEGKSVPLEERRKLLAAAMRNLQKRPGELHKLSEGEALGLVTQINESVDRIVERDGYFGRKIYVKGRLVVRPSHTTTRVILHSLRGRHTSERVKEAAGYVIARIQRKQSAKH